ncbi:MAG TPA: cytochrome P450 [Acidimicrobiia bacterium]|jgi:cytochrome P450|nr:cytochrome P450 [Acidimicrobiia bacterium]
MSLSTLHQDPGDAYADITSHDTFVRSVPHATFARMRREEPVAWVEEADGQGFWALTKHADISLASRDFARFTASRGIRIEQMAPDELEARRTMMEFDPPEHARLRRLVQPGFTPKVVATYESAFRILAGDVLDRVLSLGRFDFVTEIARELPIILLCRLLGVPESDAKQLVSWGDQMISNADPEYTPVVIDKMDTEEYRLLPFRSPAALEVFRYAEDMARERRNRPSDDIITVLLTAEPDGQPLTDLEFKNFFTLMMVAGNETTRHTVSHGLIYLLDHPDQMEQLREDPTGLSASATEEILRASSVTMHFRRTATEEIVMRGRTILPGDRVVMWYPSANHDEEVFDGPFSFDIRRHPNDHLAFGTGRHVCLGASLARLEVRVVFEELLSRVSSLEITGPPDRLRSNFINGIKHLPVEVTTV